MVPPDAENAAAVKAQSENPEVGSGTQGSDRGGSRSATLPRRKTGDAHKMNQAPIRGAIFDHGQIETIELPDGWVESDEDFYSTVGTRSLRVFHPPDTPDAVLCFYYRGLPINAQSGRDFSTVLRRPAHELNLQELALISEVLSDKQSLQTFATSAARTEDVNGKRVLVVEGRYKKNQYEVVHMFVDADGTGRAVQEIYFQAPADKFSLHHEQARAAMRSIKWK